MSAQAEVLDESRAERSRAQHIAAERRRRRDLLGTQLIAGQVDRVTAIGKAAAGLLDGGHATSLGARTFRGLTV